MHSCAVELEGHTMTYHPIPYSIHVTDTTYRRRASREELNVMLEDEETGIERELQRSGSSDPLELLAFFLSWPL